MNADGTYRRDATGQTICLWDDSQSSQAVPQVTVSNAQTLVANSDHQPAMAGTTGREQKVRSDSASSFDPNMASAAPEDVRDTIVFKGTPERGWYEPLDPRYRVRTRAEAYDFFRQGRVFAMLWAEVAGTSLGNRNGTENSRLTAYPSPAIIDGRFGENVHCNIRRFVVVRVNRHQHFVEACAITTYGNRGVLKPGCNPAEHTIVHLAGILPQPMVGEVERGMTKEPIAITPTEVTEWIHPASRIRLGKIYSIECNVKVCDIGMVVNENKTRLLHYHKQEMNNGFEPDDDDEDMTPRPPYITAPNGSWGTAPGYSAHQSPHYYNNQPYQ
ncbi:hypothetical protein GQ44DRAFT_702912 [Phaeosphaeriaceae sp. PMI808]|nr:hypothetical protein GQ44DRAFT_702912 [Phaeosphaeriaceae sp. PMI808]